MVPEHATLSKLILKHSIIEINYVINSYLHSCFVAAHLAGEVDMSYLYTVFDNSVKH